MQAYSLDLRQRVVAAYENGLDTIAEVAERFQVSQSFVKTMLARHRATGDVTPVGHRSGQTKLLTGSHRQWLLKTVLAEPDITLHDLQTKLMSKERLAVSVPTLCRELRGLNLRRKKNRWSLVKGTRENAAGTGEE